MCRSNYRVGSTVLMRRAVVAPVILTYSVKIALRRVGIGGAFYCDQLFPVYS